MVPLNGHHIRGPATGLPAKLC